MKKLSPVKRAGRDVGKVLQRYLFGLTTDDEKLQSRLISYTESLPLPSQMTAFVKLWRYPCPTGSQNYITTSGDKGEGDFSSPSPSPSPIKGEGKFVVFILYCVCLLSNKRVTGPSLTR
jgi:hypothetical protein